jgi:RNA polymerase sigma-70 factor (ECF subfamily)
MSDGPIDAGTLFRDHARFVAGFLTRLGIAPRDIDDLVQEVFLVAHRRGGFAAGTARPTTWLAEISVRVASTRRRTLRRRPEQPDDAMLSAVPAGGQDPAEALETTQSLARVQRALDAIDLDKRAVFILFELEGESCDAIAAGLGVPISTVYSRLHAARLAFTAAYEKLSSSSRTSTVNLAQRVRT